jgi:hypothetical protein
MDLILLSDKKQAEFNGYNDEQARKLLGTPINTQTNGITTTINN